MKLIIFFGLIVFSLFVSLIFSRNDFLGSIVGISLIDMVFIYVWNGFARTN